MNLKELIKEVERLNNNIDKDRLTSTISKLKLESIKQTVEVVDNLVPMRLAQEFVKPDDELKDWQTLKKLLGIE